MVSGFKRGAEGFGALEPFGRRTKLRKVWRRSASPDVSFFEKQGDRGCGQIAGCVVV